MRRIPLLAPSLLILSTPQLVAAAPQRPVREEVKVLASFPVKPQPLATWMKQHGWESKRHDPKRLVVGAGRLHMVSQKDSVMIGTERGFPLRPQKFRKLRFSIRVDRNPRGSNPHRKAGDDSAFRLYLAFDRGGGWFSPPHSIAYTWTERGQPDKPAKSPHYQQVRNLFIGHGRTLAPAKPGNEKKVPKPVFVSFERDVVADYRRCFPSEKGAVPKLVGVMLKCDSNNTSTRTSAWIQQLELVASVAKK